MKNLLQTLSFLLLVTQICFAQWVLQNPLITQNNLNDVVLIDDNNGWAVGENGTIIKTTNSGIEWSTQVSGTAYSLRGLCFTDVSIGWAVGENGTILKTTNGGSNWIQQTSGISECLNDVSFANVATGTAVGDNGTILRTTDAGITWIPQTGGGSIALEGVCFVNSNTGWAVGYDKILGTTNGGTTWSLQLDGIGGQDGALHSVYFVDENTGWAVGWSDWVGLVIKTTNGGTTWTFQTSETQAVLKDVYFTDANNGFVTGGFVAGGGMIIKTVNGGTTWTQKWILQQGFGVAFSNGNNGTIVGESGIILNTNDGGNVWVSPPTGNTNHLYGACFTNGNTGTVVGYFGTILHTTNGGQDWLTQTSGTSNHLGDISFFDTNTGWIVGDNGTILKTTNGGTNWSQQTSGTTFTLKSLYLVDANKCWAVGDSGRILTTTNGGTSWISQNYPTNFNLEDVCFSDDDNGIIVGRLGTMSGPNQIILKTTDGGVTWVEQYSGVSGELNGIAHTEANIYIAVGGAWGGSGGPFGRILRTTNGGATWTLTADIIDVRFNKVYFANPNDGWVVGTDAEFEWCLIFSTSDGGTTWIEQTINPTRGSLRDVFFIDALNGWAVGDNGTIIHTTNGGVPVELISFTATTNGKQVILNWSTATEINNQGFEIQRSTDGVEFFTVGFVNGHGTTTEQQNYSFADKNLDDGKYSYRLKQIDYDGSFEYSDVVEVDFGAFNSYSLEQNFPNPFNPTTAIGFGIQNKSNVKITVLNAIGEEVAVVLNEEREPGFHQVEFNAINLPSGVYFYQLKAGEFIQTKKMLLLK